MWKNKHVVVAMLVAPLLAIFAWYGVDAIVAERAESAKPGELYPLVARSNCRYESGQCDLINNEFKLVIRAIEVQPGKTTLALESEFPLANARLSLVSGDNEVLATVVPGRQSEIPAQWIVTIASSATPAAILRVAVTVQQSVYFAEVPVIFLQPQTTSTLTR
jgi:hypothetical protein